MPSSTNTYATFAPQAEADLVRRLQAHDEKAMTEFYDRYAAALFGVIQRIVKDESEADDVLQESLVRIWNSIENYAPDKGRLFTWVVNISRNLAIDRLRLRQQRPKNTLPDINIILSVQHQDSKSEHKDVNNNPQWVIISQAEQLDQQLDNLANMAERVGSSEFQNGFRASVVARAIAANSFLTYRDKQGNLIEEWPATGQIDVLASS